jgi:hypothetical protein
MKPAEDYILNKQEKYRTILLQLQTLIESILPEPKLHFKWGLPFYYNNDLPICYLNQSKDFVDFAFWNADHLDKYSDHFIATNRKVVRSLRFKTSEDIDPEIVIYVLEELLKLNKNPFKSIQKQGPKNC